MVELCHFSGILNRAGLLMFLLCIKKVEMGLYVLPFSNKHGNFNVEI